VRRRALPTCAQGAEDRLHTADGLRGEMGGGRRPPFSSNGGVLTRGGKPHWLQNTMTAERRLAN